MSWNNFEEFKRFSRNSGNIRKKRPASSVDWQKSSTWKRRQTSSDSISYVSNPENVTVIEGFSTDEEDDDVHLDSDSDSTLCLSRKLGKPSIKRKYSDWKALTEKRVSTSGGQDLSYADPTPNRRGGGDYKHSEFIPDGAHELLQCSNTPTEDEIFWCASDEEELPCKGFSNGPEIENCDPKAKFPRNETKLENVMKSRIYNSIQSTGNMPAKDEAISDYETDQGSSQESLSADITTPTLAPVSPVVAGTPKTASEWLKQVQQNSPHRSEVEKSPEGRSVYLNVCDSAKKKRKFSRSGLAQHLQHIISRESSEKAFWNHRLTELEQSQRTNSSQMDRCLVVQIMSDRLQGSIHLTQCLLCSDEISLPQKFLFVLFPCDTWKQFALIVGATVNIYPPWERLDITECPWPVLLGTYFCKQHSVPTQQLHAKSFKSLKGGLCIPLICESTSSHLHQSPKKNFTPLKLLFDDIHGENTKQNTTAVSKLYTAQLAQPIRSESKRGSKVDTSILNAVESSGGCSGVLATFQCLVQRVYCMKAQLTKENKETWSFSLLNQQLRSQAQSMKEIADKELCWNLLVQDVHGMFAEVQVPPRFQDSTDWKSCITNGENQVFILSNMKVRKRTNRTRSPGLFSVIKSLWYSNDDNTAKQVDKSRQTVTRESKSQETLSNCAPDFCYVLTVQESSRAMLCQETDDCGDSRRTLGSLYKPQAVKALKDFLQVPDTVNEPQRVSTLCKLLHYRSTGSSTTDSNDHSFSFELFVTDASLQYVTKSVGSFDGFLPYLKITGKSSQVLPSELKAVPTSCGMNLSAKHLLLKAQESHQLFADSYSVIRKVVPHSTAGVKSSFYVECIPEEVLDSLYTLKPVCLPDLTVHSLLGFIFRVEGVVIGVDEETACCWLVCDTCGNPDITVKRESNSQFSCSSCNCTVESPQIRTYLAVFVKVKRAKDAQVKIKLKQSTIDKLLPVSYQNSDQGYDVDTILGKQLGPMNCYVTDLSKQQHGSLAKDSFTLEEIQIQ